MALGSKLRLLIEVLLAVGAVSALGASLIFPNWIEMTVGASPDNGDGQVEWRTAFLAAAVALTALYLARRDWRALTAPHRAATAEGQR